MGEFELIERIKARFAVPEGWLGIGDDCAVIPCGDGRETLVTTDMLVEGVHFLPQLMPAYEIGWKSAAVNISDIAAMGGEPAGTFLSVALPEKFREGTWMEEFMDGFAAVSGRCPLLGGDTTSSGDRLCINVTVLGSAPAGGSVRRSGARPGDLVCVSGKLGDSAAGLKLLTSADVPWHGGAARGGETVVGSADVFSAGEGNPAAGLKACLIDGLIARHFRPLPRVAYGRALRECGAVHSMMDISDGMASDLRHILKASGVSAEIDCASVPLSDALTSVCSAFGWDALELALCGGEDYELLFTVDPEGLDAVRSAFMSISRDAAEDVCSSGIGLHVVGRIVAGTPELPAGIVWNGSARDFRGFVHF